MFEQFQGGEFVAEVRGAVGVHDVHESSAQGGGTGLLFIVVRPLFVFACVFARLLPDHFSLGDRAPQLLHAPDVPDEVFEGDQALEAGDHVAVLG